MATDERNFRSAYYEKVGFRNVEEKKSLEILLKDKPLDRSKLKQFCLRFSVPIAYRNLIWKLLLGILPKQVENHPFVMEQRRQECLDLFHALQVMKIIDNNTSKQQLFLAMWMLQSGNLRLDVNLQSESGFLAIVQSLQSFFDDDTDIFWLAKYIYGCVHRFESEIPVLIDCVCGILEREHSILYRHLQKFGGVKSLPFHLWFESCLAGLLHENPLGKIWDKLCAGSSKILVFVVVVAMTNQKQKLLKCTDTTMALECFKNISEETAEVIVNKAIEMWQQHGSPLTVNDKPKP